jgi:hypothetical protein
VGIAGGAGEDGRGFGRATPETKGDDEGWYGKADANDGVPEIGVSTKKGVARYDI